MKIDVSDLSQLIPFLFHRFLSVCASKSLKTTCSASYSPNYGVFSSNFWHKFGIKNRFWAFPPLLLISALMVRVLTRIKVGSIFSPKIPPIRPIFITPAWATTVLVVGGIVTNPQSPQLRRWAADH